MKSWRVSASLLSMRGEGSPLRKSPFDNLLRYNLTIDEGNRAISGEGELGIVGHRYNGSVMLMRKLSEDLLHVGA